MNIPLSTFPAPLLRLILCGGNGLPMAWGPLDGTYHGGSTEDSAWHPRREVAITSKGAEYHLLSDDPDELFAGDEGWVFPLDAASPWPARLAMVAAWMLGRSGVGVWLGDNDVFVTLNIATARNTIIQVAWHRSTGQRYVGSVPAPSLPALPQHLQTHPPAVALLLALYDVPEIRVRVESA